MIDFNTILNQLFVAAIEQAQKPLLEKIETLEKRVTDMDAFFAAWNFNDPDKFAEEVTKVIVDNDVLRTHTNMIAEDVVDRYDFTETINDWWRHVDISEEVDKAITNIGVVTEDSLEEAVDKALCNAIAVTPDDLDEAVEQFIRNRVTISVN